MKEASEGGTQRSRRRHHRHHSQSHSRRGRDDDLTSRRSGAPGRRDSTDESSDEGSGKFAQGRQAKQTDSRSTKKGARVISSRSRHSIRGGGGGARVDERERQDFERATGSLSSSSSSSTSSSSPSSRQSSASRQRRRRRHRFQRHQRKQSAEDSDADRSTVTPAESSEAPRRSHRSSRTRRSSRRHRSSKRRSASSASSERASVKKERHRKEGRELYSRQYRREGKADLQIRADRGRRRSSIDSLTSRLRMGSSGDDIPLSQTLADAKIELQAWIDVLTDDASAYDPVFEGIVRDFEKFEHTIEEVYVGVQRFMLGTTSLCEGMEALSDVFVNTVAKNSGEAVISSDCCKYREAIHRITRADAPLSAITKLKRDFAFNIGNPLRSFVEHNKNLHTQLKLRKSKLQTLLIELKRFSSLKEDKSINPKDQRYVQAEANCLIAEKEFVEIDRRVVEWLFMLDEYKGDIYDTLVHTVKYLQHDFFNNARHAVASSLPVRMEFRPMVEMTPEEIGPQVELEIYEAAARGETSCNIKLSNGEAGDKKKGKGKRGSRRVKTEKDEDDLGRLEGPNSVVKGRTTPVDTTVRLLARWERGRRQLSSDRAPEEPKVAVDVLSLLTLTSQGFDQEDARKALVKFKNNTEEALEWLVEGMPSKPSPITAEKSTEAPKDDVDSVRVPTTRKWARKLAQHHQQQQQRHLRRGVSSSTLSGSAEDTTHQRRRRHRSHSSRSHSKQRNETRRSRRDDRRRESRRKGKRREDKNESENEGKDRDTTTTIERDDGGREDDRRRSGGKRSEKSRGSITEDEKGPVVTVQDGSPGKHHSAVKSVDLLGQNSSASTAEVSGGMSLLEPVEVELLEIPTGSTNGEEHPPLLIGSASVGFPRTAAEYAKELLPLQESATSMLPVQTISTPTSTAANVSNLFLGTGKAAKANEKVSLVTATPAPEPDRLRDLAFDQLGFHDGLGDKKGRESDGADTAGTVGTTLSAEVPTLPGPGGGEQTEAGRLGESSGDASAQIEEGGIDEWRKREGEKSTKDFVDEPSFGDGDGGDDVGSDSGGDHLRTVSCNNTASHNNANGTSNNGDVGIDGDIDGGWIQTGAAVGEFETEADILINSNVD